VTYIKLEQAHTDDERWIEAGADAFAIHVAALVYCDRQLQDGRISRPMALRVSLAVPPERAEAAIHELVKRGFWREVADGFEVVDFHEHAFPAEQVKRTRERWKVDKERRRQHSIGDHSLCKDPKFCPAIRSTVESSEDSTGGGSHLYKTQSDQTRPDRRSGSGNGRVAGLGAGAPARHFQQDERRWRGWEPTDEAHPFVPSLTDPDLCAWQSDDYVCVGRHRDSWEHGHAWLPVNDTYRECVKCSMPQAHAIHSERVASDERNSA
jgi:hypothetical protein